MFCGGDNCVCVSRPRRMKFDDFCQTFAHYVKCGQMKHMHSSVMHSEWAEPNKTGGSIENKKTFLSNPQVVFSASSFYLTPS